MALRIFAFVFLLIILLGLGRWALQVSEKPSEMTASIETAIAPVREFLLGKDTLLGFKLKKGSAQISLALRPNGWWWMLEPERGMARQTMVHQWIDTLTKPKLQRVMQPEEWNPTAIEDFVDIELTGVHSKTTLQWIRLESQPNFYYLKLSNGVVLKAEHLVSPTWSERSEDWRTRRLWPFEKIAVKEMIYRQGDIERSWLRTEKGWSSAVEPGEVWPRYFQEWDAMSCESFKTPFVPNGKALAEWEFHFEESGAKSLLELYRTEWGEWLTVYRGSPTAQVLSLETVQKAFPEGPWNSAQP